MNLVGIIRLAKDQGSRIARPSTASEAFTIGIVVDTRRFELLEGTSKMIEKYRRLKYK